MKEVINDEMAWKESLAIAFSMLSFDFKDNTENSLFYHADYIEEPYWVDDLNLVSQIDKHIFYNER